MRNKLSAIIVSAIIIVAGLVFQGCGPKNPWDEGAIFQAYQSTSAGYGFVHSSVVAFSKLVAAQMNWACDDPNSQVCLGLKKYQKLYEDVLYPKSIEITALWDNAVEVFDEYRQNTSPTDSDTQKVLAALQAVEKVMGDLKIEFERVGPSTPGATKVIQDIDLFADNLESMKMEVAR